VRIDTYFVLLIPAAVALFFFWRREWRWSQLLFFAPVLFLAAHSLIHALGWSGPYFWGTFGYAFQLMARLWIIPLVALLALLGLLLRYRRRLGQLGSQRRRLLGTAAVLLLALALYAWLIRPLAETPSGWFDWYGGRDILSSDAENLSRLGWYLSPLGIGLAIAGAALMTWRLDRRLAPVLGVGLFFSVLYLWRIQANPHQIYAMRRYVSAVMPFFILAATYLLAELGQRRPIWRRGLAGALALAWLAGVLWSARGFVTQVDYAGLHAQLARLDETLEPGAIVLFTDPAAVGVGDTLGTPLRFLFGHPVFVVRQPESLNDERLAATVQQWLEAGHTVYWSGPMEWLERQGWSYQSQPVDITTEALEGVYDRKPTAIQSWRWQMELARIALP
jgi:hypothetical protein